MGNKDTLSAELNSHIFDALFKRDGACKMKKNSQEQERDNHPGHEENANCIVLHARLGLVCIADTRARDEENRE